MSLSSILKDCVVSVGADASAAGTTEVDSAVLDMAGFDGVMFIALTGDVTSGSVLTLTVKENTASSTSSPTPSAVSGGSATFTAGATDADIKALVVDVDAHFLTKRYVFAALTRTTQNAVVNGIVAIRYKAKNKPTTADATVIASAVLP